MKAARRSIAAFAVFGAAFFLWSCPQPLDETFVTDIMESVEFAVAPSRTLVVSGDGNGVVSPAGGNSVKDGFAFDVNATAFSAYDFSRWVQTDGTGIASFADAASASTAVTVTGGDATIQAEFEARPTVYYATPTGNGIYTNAAVFVYFSKPMDEESLASAFSVLKDGMVPVAGDIMMLSETVARFDSESLLSPCRTFVIKISREARDALGVAMEDDYSMSFMTGSTEDNDPPSVFSFTLEWDGVTIVGDESDDEYAGSRDVSLTGISAADLGGNVAGILIGENGGDDVFIPIADSVDYRLASPGDGEKELVVRAMDSAGNVTDGVSTTRTFALDTAAPVVSVFKAEGTGDGSDLYTNTASVFLTCSASDAAGTAMEMRFSNDGASWGPWVAYAAAQAHTLLSGEGSKRVYAQFRDTAFPETHVSAASYAIRLDQTPPSSSAFTVDYVGPDAAYVSGTRTVSCSAADAFAVWKVETYIGGALVGTDTTAGYSYSWATTGYATGSSYTVNCVVYDRAGNSLAGSSVSRTVDNTAPSISAFQIGGTGDGTNAYTNSTSPTLSQTASDNLSSMQMRFGNSTSTFTSWAPYAATSAFALTATDGTRYVYAQIRDLAGNISPTVSDSIILDRAAPSSSAFSVDYAGSNASYLRGTRTITASPSDALSGVWMVRFYIGGSLKSTVTASPFTYSWDTTAYVQGATYAVLCRTYDRAGNYADGPSVSRVIDNVGPTSVAISAPSAGADVDGTLSVTATATDAVGMFGVQFYGAGVNLDWDTDASDTSYTSANAWDVRSDYAEGSSQSVTAYAYDLAGNCTTATASVTIDNWDATPITIADAGTAGASYGQYPSIALDPANGYVYIAYIDSTNGDIDVVRSANGGTSWTGVGSIATGGSSSSRVTLAVDDSGYMYAAYSISTTVYFAKSTDYGANWATKALTSASVDGETSVIKLDYSGSTTVVHVGLVYCSASNYRIYDFYSLNAGTSFSATALTAATTNSLTSVAGAIIQGDHAYFVWFDATAKLLYVGGRVSTTAALSLAATAISSAGVGAYPSVSAIDSPSPTTTNDYVMVTCRGTTALARLFSIDTGVTWSAETVASGSASAYSSVWANAYRVSPTLAIYNDSYQVAYYDYPEYDLRVAKSADGSTWYGYTVDETGTVGFYPDIFTTATSSSSTFYVAYYDSTNTNLKFVKAVINY